MRIHIVSSNRNFCMLVKWYQLVFLLSRGIHARASHHVVPLAFITTKVNDRLSSANTANLQVMHRRDFIGAAARRRTFLSVERD